jgi:hypothetical protein
MSPYKDLPCEILIRALLVLGLTVNDLMRYHLIAKLARSGSGPPVVAGLTQIIESGMLSRAARLARVQSFSLHGLAATLRDLGVVGTLLNFATAMNTFKR